MKNRILLVGQGNSFMTQTIYHALKDASYNVTIAPPAVQAMQPFIKDIDIVLFNLSDYVFSEKDVLKYAKELVMSHGKLLCVIGDIPETQAFQEVVPDRLVSLHMSRPVNVRHLVSNMMRVALLDSTWKDRKDIIVVDDDSTFLDTVSEWLEDTGDYRVTVVNSGMQAITYLADHKPDLILLDYEMPVVTGEQVLHMIRSDERTRDLKVVFLTGKNDRESVEAVIRLHPDGYILKTAGRDYLVQHVEEFFKELKNDNSFEENGTGEAPEAPEEHRESTDGLSEADFPTDWI